MITTALDKINILIWTNVASQLHGKLTAKQAAAKKTGLTVITTATVILITGGKRERTCVCMRSVSHALMRLLYVTWRSQLAGVVMSPN